jgi:MoaA/NifB/PqqE/SkfB family radical SAM enzyme
MNNEKMTLEEALFYIDKIIASDYKKIKKVTITGGEPFIYFNELLKLADHCNFNNLDFGVVTNAFWASSEEKTIKRLSALSEKGLEEIGVSCDPSHLKFIPLKNIQNCIDVATDIGLRVEINSSCNDQTFSLENTISNIKRDNISFCQNPIIRIDHYKIPINSNFERSLDEISKDNCFLLRHLAVHPNGDVYPCCSVVGLSGKLLVGNLKKDSLSQIIDTIFINSYLNIIEKMNFEGIVEDLKNIGIDIPEKFIFECELCHYLLNYVDDVSLNRVIEKNEIKCIDFLMHSLAANPA